MIRIGALNPYPAYQDCGLSWLERIPATWRVLRAKNVFRVLDVRSDTGEEELLTVSSRDGVVPRSEKTVTMFKAESYVGHKLCWPGDLVVNSLWAWMQGLGFTRHHGVVSSAYSVYRPRTDFRQYADYLHYALRSSAYKWELVTRSKGVWLSRLQLSDPAFLDMPVIIPQASDQSAVVRFLDHAERRVRRYIRAKRRLIALLNEQKQAIIHRVVTRGLDPAVHTKPSGVKWLVEVPEHWDVLPFVRCAVERSDYRGATPEKVDAGIFLVTTRNIRMGWIDYATSKEYVRADQYAHIMRRGLPRKGDLLLTTEAPLGHVALVDREDVAFAQRIIRFRLNSRRLLPEFALFSLTSRYFQDQLQMRATGSTAQGIKASKLPQLLVILPSVAEQQDIVDWLTEQLAPLDTAAAGAKQEIDLVREYRTRLIGDVVTGKLDVREVAAQLPDEPGELEAAEDAVAAAESEEIMQDEELVATAAEPADDD